MYKIRQRLRRRVRVRKQETNRKRAKITKEREERKGNRNRERERERERERRKAKRSFIIDQRNRVSLPSPIAHSIQAVLRLPIKNTSFACLFVTQPRPVDTRYTMYSAYTR